VGQLSSGVRQSVFGNAGTLITFRLGIDDAPLLSKEYRGFTAEEILDLEKFHALVRPETSSRTFNVRTFPDPGLPLVDPVSRIHENNRTRFCRPKAEVEKELGHINEDTVSRGSDEPPSASDPDESDLMP
jgi:hypothetical protein